MNICFCIPARFRSTRLDKKLLLEFNGKTCLNLTIEKVSQSKYYNGKNLFLLTDSEELAKTVTNENITIIITTQSCINGTERISKNLNMIPNTYDIIVNIQADEPFISPKNIDVAIEKHRQACSIHPKLFYTTLHEERNEVDYLKSTASLKLITDKNDKVLYYSRNIIPWNKHGIINNDVTYKTFTGIYVFKRDLLKIYSQLPNTPLQLEEDCEQLKIIENGFDIISYPTVEFNEISLNTKKDHQFLLEKYCNLKKSTKHKKIKLAVFDIDGVFTNGKIYVSHNNSYKCYNGKDTYALKLLRDKGIKIGIITAHDTPILDNMEHIIKRADLISKGNYNKLDVLNEWCKQLNISYDEISYIGDDIPDIPILQQVTLSGCPNDAIKEVKTICKYVCKNNGGNGAVREFCSIILNH